VLSYAVPLEGQSPSASLREWWNCGLRVMAITREKFLAKAALLRASSVAAMKKPEPRCEL
jgi:hypothetical protein